MRGCQKRRMLRKVTGQSRTLRIKQLHGLDFSTADSTSPHRAVVIVPLSDFHEVSRAAGPKGQARNFSMENWERQEDGKRSKGKRKEREMVSKQPSSTAEIR